MKGPRAAHVLPCYPGSGWHTRLCSCDPRSGQWGPVTFRSTDECGVKELKAEEQLQMSQQGSATGKWIKTHETQKVSRVVWGPWRDQRALEGPEGPAGQAGPPGAASGQGLDFPANPPVLLCIPT